MRSLVRRYIKTAIAFLVVGPLVFFRTMWSRIRGVGSQAREAKGERF